ncbi:MAG: hypothetical protein U1F35_13340 [Steroidobacteraceae bacterium]
MAFPEKARRGFTLVVAIIQRKRGFRRMPSINSSADQFLGGDSERSGLIAFDFAPSDAKPGRNLSTVVTIWASIEI